MGAFLQWGCGSTPRSLSFHSRKGLQIRPKQTSESKDQGIEGRLGFLAAFPEGNAVEQADRIDSIHLTFGVGGILYLVPVIDPRCSLH